MMIMASRMRGSYNRHGLVGVHAGKNMRGCERTAIDDVSMWYLTLDDSSSHGPHESHKVRYVVFGEQLCS